MLTVISGEPLYPLTLDRGRTVCSKFTFFHYFPLQILFQPLHHKKHMSNCSLSFRQTGQLESNPGWFYSNQLIVYRAKTWEIPESKIATIDRIVIRALPQDIYKSVTGEWIFPLLFGMYVIVAINAAIDVVNMISCHRHVTVNCSQCLICN